MKKKKGLRYLIKVNGKTAWEGSKPAVEIFDKIRKENPGKEVGVAIDPGKEILVA